MGRGLKKRFKPPVPAKKCINLETWKRVGKIPSKKELLDEIKGLVPKTMNGVPELPFYNILLTGQIGSGKSSFFNSINSIFTERVFNKAETGEKGQSLTQEFRMRQIRPGPDPLSKPLPFRIFDTQGLVYKNEDKDYDDYKEYEEHDVRNILSCVDGNVPDKHVFAEKDFYIDCPGFIKDPQLKDKVHCVCIAIDVSSYRMMHKPIWRKITSMMSGLASRSIPILVLLTKIDSIDCEAVQRDPVKNIFRSKLVRDEYVRPIQENMKRYVTEREQFLPVMNYVQEVEFNNEDILLLLALRQILKSAQAYLDLHCREMNA